MDIINYNDYNIILIERESQIADVYKKKYNYIVLQLHFDINFNNEILEFLKENHIFDEGYYLLYQGDEEGVGKINIPYNDLCDIIYKFSINKKYDNIMAFIKIDIKNKNIKNEDVRVSSF